MVTFGRDPACGGESEPGCKVVDDEDESSRSSDGGDGGAGRDSLISERSPWPSFCRDRSFWIRDWENGVL